MTENKLAKQNTELDGYNEIKNFAEAFIKSGYFSDVKSLAQGIVKIQAGRELGLQPVYSIQKLYFIKGRLGMAAETMAVLFHRNSQYDYRIKEHTDDKCVIEFYLKSTPQELYYTSSFTMQDAKRAKLIYADSTWEKFPRAMLFSRAISQGVRIVDPSAIAGGYTVEELQSIPVEFNSDDDLKEEIKTEPEAKKAPASDKPQLATAKLTNQIRDLLPVLEISVEQFVEKVLKNNYGCGLITDVLTVAQVEALIEIMLLCKAENVRGEKAIAELQKLKK